MIFALSVVLCCSCGMHSTHLLPTIRRDVEVDVWGEMFDHGRQRPQHDTLIYGLFSPPSVCLSVSRECSVMHPTSRHTNAAYIRCPAVSRTSVICRTAKPRIYKYLCSSCAPFCRGITVSTNQGCQRPDLRNVLQLSYDYLTIMPKLRSTHDGRVIYKMSYTTNARLF